MIKGLHHAAYRCRDSEETRAFYEDFLGLPLATAVQLYGLFLAPLFLVAFAYALTFDRFGLRRDELASLRRRFPRRGVDPEADGGGGG